MAVEHIYFQQNSQHGLIQRNALQQLEGGLASFDHNFGVMNTMLNGGNTQDVHFTELTIRYGYPNDATAHQAWNEMNALMIQLNTIRDSLEQAFNKFR